MNFTYVFSFALLFISFQLFIVYSVFPALVRNHIRKLGGQIEKVQVKGVGQFLIFPLEIVYEVRYMDVKGYEHDAIVKPNLWRPLISEDKIVTRK